MGSQWEDFERESQEVDKEFDREDSANENVIEWIRGSKTTTVTFTNRKFINKVRAFAEKYPEEVQITADNADGSIVAHIPLSYIKINRPAQRDLTEEEREVLRERINKARASRNM